MQFAAGNVPPRHIHKPPHCSTSMNKGVDIRAGQRTEHSPYCSLWLLLSTFLAHGSQYSPRNMRGTVWGTRGHDPSKNDHLFLASEAENKFWHLLLDKMSFSTSFTEALVGPMFFIRLLNCLREELFQTKDHEV